MQIETVSNVTEQATGGHSFTIVNSEFAFKILSNGLYSRKIEAVIRELSTNAADEHIFAGKREVPFEVTLPSYTGSIFSIRDFGNGLSDADAISLYTKFFESTKRQDNEVDGCLGLGSKSPFAVTNEFQVTSWHGGMKNVYKCFKSSGIPMLKNIHSEASDEPTGVMVSLKPLSEYSRVSDWESYAERVYKFFAVKPKVNVDLDMTLEEPLLHGDGWSIHPNLRENYARMGNIAYPIDFYSVAGGEENNLLIKDLRTMKGLILQFNLGDFSFTPNREELDYNEKTRTALTAAAKKMVDFLMESMRSVVSQASSLYQARMLFIAKRKHLLGMFDARLTDGIHSKVSAMNLKFNDQELFSSNNVVGLSTTLNCIVKSLRYSRINNKIKCTTDSETSYNFNDPVKIFYHESKAQKGRVRRFLAKDDDLDAVILLPKSDAQNLAYILGHDGDLNEIFSNVDSLPAVTSYSLKVIKQAISAQGYMTQGKVEGVIDENDECFYVIRNRDKYYFGSKVFNVDQMNSLIRISFKFGIDMPTHFITLTAAEAEKQKIEEKDNLQEFVSYLIGNISSKLNDGKQEFKDLLCSKKKLYDLKDHDLNHDMQLCKENVMKLKDNHSLKRLLQYIGNGNPEPSPKVGMMLAALEVLRCFDNGVIKNIFRIDDGSETSRNGLLSMSGIFAQINSMCSRIETNIFDSYKIALVRDSGKNLDILNSMYESGLMPEVVWNESPTKDFNFVLNLS